MRMRKIISAFVGAAMTLSSVAASAQSVVSNGPGPGPRGGGPGCDFFPAPPSIGSAVGLGYFGPPPSTVNPSLVGPLPLLGNGQVNELEGNVTVPLYRGFTLIRSFRDFNRDTDTIIHDRRGRPFALRETWFLLTDTTDQGQAQSLGLNFAPKLQFAGDVIVDAVLNADGMLIFESGLVDFTPDRVLVASETDENGEGAFPPAEFRPGSVGDDGYSPIIRIVNGGGIIYNAPVVAQGASIEEIHFPDGDPDYSVVHDSILAISTTAQDEFGNPELDDDGNVEFDEFEATATLQLVQGFTFGRPLWYMVTEASLDVAAAIEHVTYAPRLQGIIVGRDDSFSSAVERIFIATNGPSDGGCENPQRQGLNASLRDGFRPNNVFGGVNTVATDYSPLWDANLYEWTPEAIAAGHRSLENEEFRILTLVQEGFLTGPGGTDFGSAGFIINCPPVQRLL